MPAAICSTHAFACVSLACSSHDMFAGVMSYFAGNDDGKLGRVLIFTSTKAEAAELSNQIAELGIGVSPASLTGDMSQVRATLPCSAVFRVSKLLL